MAQPKDQLINLKQIAHGSELLRMLSGYDAAKVFSNIVIPTRVVDEVIDTLTEDGAIQLANTNLVVDVLHKLIINADGDRLAQELYTIDTVTGIITPAEGHTFEVGEPHVLKISYSYLPEDAVDKYNVDQVIDLIKSALDDTSTLEDKIKKLGESVNKEIHKITSKPIQDRIKVVAKANNETVDEVITSKVVIDPPFDQDLLDKLQIATEYMLFHEDNTPVLSTEGKYVTYNIETAVVTGIIAKRDEESTSETPVYLPITEEITVKFFPIGSFTFAELPEDYLLDNDEFVASSYQAAIDKLAAELAHNKEVIDAVAKLVNESIQTAITALEKIINGDEETGTTGLVEKVQTLEEKQVYVNEEAIITPHGGVKAGQTFEKGIEMRDLMTKILYPYVKVLAGINAQGGQTLREIGDTVTFTGISGTGTKKTNKIKDAYFTVLGTKVPVEEEITGKTQTFTLTDVSSYSITNDTPNKKVVFTVVTDNEDLNGDDVANAETVYTFINPAYIGTVGKDVTIDSAAIKALTKKLQQPANLTQGFTGEEVKMVFACPQGWTVKKMIDQNGFDITASFTAQTVSVECLDGTNRDYTVYVSGVTTVSDFRVTFNR